MVQRPGREGQLWIVLLLLCGLCSSHSDQRPHHSASRLKPFSGLPLPYTLTAYEKKLLLKGKPVISRDEGEKSEQSSRLQVKRNGRAKIIQDVAAPPNICLDKMLDFDNYSNMVSLLKSFNIYERFQFDNGTDISCAKYEVGLLSLRLGYFLRQRYIPQFNTLTWTLDYSKDSDFDDNIGHWQIMSHPSKQNWSRVLFSTEAILPDWLPSFAVRLIEKVALTESTGWLKKESEKKFKEIRDIGGKTNLKAFKNIPHSYVEEESSNGIVAKYVPFVFFENNNDAHMGESEQIIHKKDREKEPCRRKTCDSWYRRSRINKIRIKHNIDL